MASRFIHACVLASSHQYSEDRAVVFERGDAVIAVVADGARGLRGGATAAEALVLAIRASVSAGGEDVPSTAELSSAFKRTDIALASKMTGETTGVLVVVTPRGVFGVSAGDSEACGSLRQTASMI